MSLNNRARGATPGRDSIKPGSKPKNARAAIKRLLKYFIHNKTLLILLLFILPLGPLSNLVGGWFIKPLINDYIIPGDIIGLKNMLLFVALVYVAGIGGTYLQNRLLVKISLGATAKMRADLFGKMQELPMDYFDSHKNGELMSRYTNDMDQVQLALEGSVVQLLSSVISFACALFMMIYLSPLMFIITGCAIFGTVRVGAWLGKKSRRLFQRQQKTLGELNGYIEEMIEGLPEVKAFGRESEAKNGFLELSDDYRDAATNAAFFSGIVMPISNNISLIGYAITAAVGGLLTLAGRFDIGSLGSYLQFTRQTNHPIQHITSQFNTVLSALAGAERIFEMMDATPETDDGEVSLQKTGGGWEWRLPQVDGGWAVRPFLGEVRLNNVSFSYDKETPVLENISLVVKPGQKLALVGSTGAGKTTITNLLTRFYEVDDGSITYDGIDIRQIKKEDLRRSLSMVLQDTHLFCDTIMENIRYGCLTASEDDCIQAAKSVNAHGFIDKLPDGYNTVLSPDGSNLSQGQRQLLAIARAACANTPLMVLDEATSSIDTRTEHQIESGLDRLMQGRTVFIIAHRLSTVRNADATIVIENGEIIEQGSHAELLEQKGYYYKLYNGQYQLA